MWLLGMREVSGAACARAFVRVCKGAFGAMLAHIPKDSLDVGVVNQRLCHHLDALALGVRVTCTGGSDRLAYVCSAGGVFMVRLALSLTTWAEPAVGDRAPAAVAPPYEAVRLRLAE